MSGQAQDTSSGRPTYVRLTEEQRERLFEIAQSEHRTLSGHLRMLVVQHLAEHDDDAVGQAA